MKSIGTDRHSNNFDFIRLIAAVLVIISHSIVFLGINQEDILGKFSRGTISFSHLGVATFFIISGYLITQSALHSTSWKSFLWKRVLRLIPGLLIVLLLCAFILGPIVTSEPLNYYFSNKETYHFLLSVFLYVQKYSLPGVFENNPINAVNGSLWTIAYEFTLYILVMFGFLFGIMKKRNLVLCLWIVFLSFRIYIGNKFFWYGYASPITLNLNMMYVFEWSFYFLSGMLVFLYRDLNIIKLKILIILFCSYILAASLNQKEILYILNYIFVPYLVFYLSFIPGRLNAFGKFGDFSYGFYIYAFPLQQALIYILGLDIHLNLFVLLSIFATFPFAVASLFLIEKKSMKYKNIIK
jgi:peptidoglycan/LPS O-acetylase OafA/YrhL